MASGPLKMTILNEFRAGINYGYLSERFLDALHNVHFYELLEDELKLSSSELDSVSLQKEKIVMVFKKDEL